MTDARELVIISFVLGKHTADPAAWGYTYNSTTERLGALDPSTAFKLHILGSDKGTVKVPPLLTSAGVLQIHAGTSYEEYYSILGRMVRTFAYAGFSCRDRVIG